MIYMEVSKLNYNNRGIIFSIVKETVILDSIIRDGIVNYKFVDKSGNAYLIYDIECIILPNGKRITFHEDLW